MSNILKIFNPPDIKGEPVNQEDCVPCLLMSSGVMLLGGSYMASGAVFATPDNKPLPKAATPLWRGSVRGVGAVVAVLGLVRGIQGLMVAQKKSEEKL